MALHNDIGLLGENLAKQHLTANGYTILASNYRYKKAEIDIIALKNETLAIIEVKTRSTSHFGQPESFVTNKKIKLVIEAANAYITANNYDYDVSLDIISVVLSNPPVIEHIENAYYFL